MVFENKFEKLVNFPRLLFSAVAGNKQNLSGDHSAVAPPDPMPNSEVKRSSADGSVGSPHVRVGHRQAPNLSSPLATAGYLFRSTSGVNIRFLLFSQTVKKARILS